MLHLETVIIFLVIVNCDANSEVERKDINWSNKNLSSIPNRTEEFVASINLLDFSHNHIECLSGINSWKEVIILDLSFNKLDRISDNDFMNFENLKELNLKHNDFTTWNLQNWTHTFPSLQSLDISHNRNLGDHSRTFESAFVSIRHSNVSSLNASDISWNKPPLDFFTNFSSLKHLNLSSNCLSHIPIIPVNVKHLDLSHNCIQHIEKNCFSDAMSLDTLNLSYNILLEKISSDSFRALLNLTDVSFVHCTKLSHIPSDLFSNNFKMHTVSFRACNFSTLQGKLKKTFLRLYRVDLTDNPWHCNSSIKWFADLIKHEVTDFSPHFRCYSPQESLMEKWLGPKVQRNMRLALAATCVILALVLVGAIVYSCRMEARRRRALAASYSPLGRKVNPHHNQDITATTVL